jgi:hypothetical protein
MKPRDALRSSSRKGEALSGTVTNRRPHFFAIPARASLGRDDDARDGRDDDALGEVGGVCLARPYKPLFNHAPGFGIPGKPPLVKQGCDDDIKLFEFWPNELALLR